MADDAPPVAPMPGFATDAEIVKQALEKLHGSVDSLSELMRRSQQQPPPPTNGNVSRGQIINIALGALLTATLTFAGVSYWRSTDRLDLIEETARAADRKVDQIIKDDAGRKAYVDGRLENLAQRLEPLGVMIERIQRLELGAKDFDKSLSQNRESALAANEKIIDALNASKTELALLRQELQQTRSLIEGQRPALKRPSMLWPRRARPSILLASMRRADAPFMLALEGEDEPLDGEEIADSIDADRGQIEMMRGWLRRMRDMLAARAPVEPEALEITPAPRQGESARPAVREAEPRLEPARRVTKLRSARKRLRRTATRYSFTRALERSFGRPTFRGRYWNSLYRSGGVLK